MIILIVAALAIAICSFLLGWGMSSDARSDGYYDTSSEDKIVNEMRRQRAESFIGADPIVRELQRESQLKDLTRPN